MTIQSSSKDYSLDGVTTKIPTISPADLHAEAGDSGEIAIVDVREGNRYETGHISIAVQLPLSEIELRVKQLLPRKGIRLVVTDDGGGSIGERAVRRLAELGYSNVRLLEGGVANWRDAGFELITGLNSLSKALGEFVERRYHTPKISAEELHGKIASGEDIVILDTRPLDEFHHISIPGALAAPGAELLYRAFDAVRSPDTPVIINCAGRTRAIIGAQALRNAGFPNPVVSLENGTAAWLLAGYEPGRHATEIAAVPTPEGLTRAKQAAQEIAARFQVQRIDVGRLERFRAERHERSLYLFDIRTADEFLAGHLPGSRSAPGGQLIQATDTFVSTREGRIVLIDDEDAVRATITASWLIQLGLENVFVYAAHAGDFSEVGETPTPVLDASSDITGISPKQAHLLLSSEHGVVLDLDPAPPYFRERHYIPGSHVARRSTLETSLDRVPGTGPIVLTSTNGDLARLAAVDLRRHTSREVLPLEGGTNAWIAAGLDHRTGLDQPALNSAEALAPSPTLEERRVNLDAYVKWGDVITDQLARDGLVHFRAFD